ncbi:MAG: mechanosensitive ion channel family protein [Gemmatimonadota bacterium]
MLESSLQQVREYLYSEGPVLGVFTLILIWLGYQVSRRLVARILKARAYKEDNVQNFLFIWRYLWLMSGAIFGIVSFSGSLATLGISAAFLGMVLGWSLQAPVTGVAAWLMIIMKRPFKIGDRVIIAGIIGDVVDITLTHVLLNQVGGTIGGEEKSGRGVLIPNATMFGQIIYNYTLEGVRGGQGGGAETANTPNYILDEVPIRLTYQSDFDEAERIFLDAARQVTGDIIRDSGEAPFIRAELFDSGIVVRLRYQTQAKDRQRISSDIVRIIIREFAVSPTVEFCYPHVSLYHSPRTGPQGGPAPAPPMAVTGPA